MTIPNYTYTNPTIYKLVGGFNPSENMSQLGWLFPYIMEKKQHVPTPPTSSVFPNRMSYRTVSAMKDSGRLIIFSALRAPDGSVYPLEKRCTYMVYAHISMVNSDGVQTNFNGDFMMIQWDIVI